MCVYKHRVVAAVGLMLRDALLAANDASHVSVRGGGGEGGKNHVQLKLSECGGCLDANLNGYVQLVDGTVQVSH